MKKTNWSPARLIQLFQRYNSRYWKGKLSRYVVKIGDLSDRGAIGLCLFIEHEIVVDVAAHSNDAEIRSTLLHEMAHAADKSTSRYAHGDGFFEQIEHLLRQKAPISLTMAEMPGHKFPLAAVPKKFPLCRKAAVTLEGNRNRRLNRVLNECIVIEETDGDVVRRFEDAAMELTWKTAKSIIGRENGLIDIGGRATSAWAERVLKRGKRVFDNARRNHLACMKLQKQIAMLPVPKSE